MRAAELTASINEIVNNKNRMKGLNDQKFDLWTGPMFISDNKKISLQNLIDTAKFYNIPNEAMTVYFGLDKDGILINDNWIFAVKKDFAGSLNSVISEPIFSGRIKVVGDRNISVYVNRDKNVSRYVNIKSLKSDIRPVEL